MAEFMRFVCYANCHCVMLTAYRAPQPRETCPTHGNYWISGPELIGVTTGDDPGLYPCESDCHAQGVLIP